MAIGDICDPATYEDDEYTRQYEMPTMQKPLQYDYIKCFFLHATASLVKLEEDDHEKPSGEQDAEQIGDPIQQLDFWLTAAKGDDQIDGTLVNGGPSLKDRITELLAVPLIQRIPTTMDFFLRYPTRVVIILVGANWRFSSKKHPATMKHDYAEQYVDLQYHFLDANNDLQSPSLPPLGIPRNGFRCFSFTASQPCAERSPAENIYHGFNVNLELLRAGYRPLEFTVDPDVENKGNPPPPPFEDD